jgi:hypothetical protein
MTGYASAQNRASYSSSPPREHSSAGGQRSPTGNRGNYRNLIPLLNRRLQILQETHVLVIEVHIDESVQDTRPFKQPALYPRSPDPQLLQNLTHRHPPGLDYIATLGVLAKRRRNPNPNGHTPYLSPNNATSHARTPKIHATVCLHISPSTSVNRLTCWRNEWIHLPLSASPPG